MSDRSQRHELIRSGASVFALAFAVTATGPALAQEAAEAPSARRLEVVTVTAEKREESIQDVAVSITAISGENLTAAGVTDLSTLDKLAPGLQFGQSGNDARPAIRGARTENVSVQQDPIVSFYVDGVYRSLTSQALASIVDVNRVEVLRGPQGTLYGRNAFGGAVNIISNQPTADSEYGGNVTLGNFNRRRVEGFGNVALTENLFLRLTGAIDQHDFQVENAFNPAAGLRDKDESYVRAQLRWEPSENMDFTLRASQWTAGGNGGSDFGFKLIGIPVDPTPLTAGITFAEVVNATINPVNPRVGGGNSPIIADPFTIDFDYNSTLDTKQDTVDLEGNFGLGFADFKVLVSYADFDSYRDADTDFSRFPSGFSGEKDDVIAYTQEFQLTSATDGPLEWTLGAYLLQEDKSGLFLFDRFQNTNPATNQPNGTIAAFGADFNSLAEVETDSKAVFGQATFSLTEALRVTAGLRYTEDKKDFARRTTSENTFPTSFYTASGVPSAVFRDSATFDKTTWKLGGEFDLSPDSLLYANASTGFQSGGFNNGTNLATNSAAFGPQTVMAYEIGSKNVLLGGSLVFNAAIFRNEFEDLLAQQFVNVGATTLAISTNAGEATATGVELEADLQATDALLLTARAAFQNAEFGTYLLQEPVSGATVDLDGGRVPLMPDMTLGVSAIYDIAIGNGATLSPSGGLYYSSEYSTNDIDYVFAEQDAYTKVDLRLTYTPASDIWYVEAFGNNVTDEEVFNRSVRFGQNAIGRNYAEPSTFGVRFGFRN